eukprot:m.263070 g.263070  ORF g.263070 m.263070 type:complete len:629 (-) comp11050_c1_seq2:99-1985(-)
MSSRPVPVPSGGNMMQNSFGSPAAKSPVANPSPLRGGVLRRHHQQIGRPLRKSEQHLKIELVDSNAPELLTKDEIANQTQRLFRAYQTRDCIVPKAKFLHDLKQTGIAIDDPRLRDFVRRMHQSGSELTYESFSRVVGNSSRLLLAALSGDLVIPEFRSFCTEFNTVYLLAAHSYEPLNDSTTLDDLPPETGLERLRLQSENFGEIEFHAAVTTVDGQRHNQGNPRQSFIIGECVTPLIYAIALDLVGGDVVQEHVGREHSGGHFDDISVNKDGKPYNPLTAAGALMCCALIKPELNTARRYVFVLQRMQELAGGLKLNFNQEKYLLAHENIFRLKATAHFMQGYNKFPEKFNLDDTINLYVQLTCLEITVETGSIIAATLANGGVSPLSGKRVIGADHVRDVLAVMHTCGMDSFSGNWAFTIGFPASNSRNGCILGVVPSLMGICTFAQNDTEEEISPEGLSFCSQLASSFSLGTTMSRFNVEVDFENEETIRDPRKFRNEFMESVTISAMRSARMGDIGALRIIHKLNRLDVRDYHNRNALHVACQHGSAECVRFLARKMRFSSLTACCGDGQTPMEVARDDDIRAILRQGIAARVAQKRWRALREFLLCTYFWMRISGFLILRDV